MSDLGLGKIITGEQHRDAIHVAVAPVTASEKLYPGQPIGVIGGDKVSAGGAHVGIVDPFLQMPVFEGQRFWLFLFPNTVTGMRHEWQHPAFSDATAASINVAPLATGNAEESRKWIESFAERIQQDYGDLMGAADRYAEHGDYTYDSSESYKNHWDDFEEFWKHYEVVAGKKGPEKGDTFFTCPC